MNIILVDDTPDHLNLLAEFVQELRPDATVHRLQNGMDLPRYLEQQHADLIMMDLMMPGISGMDLVQQVRSSTRWINLPIVAVSGLNQHQHQQKLIQAGFNDYIFKPYELDELARILEQHLPV